MLLRWEEEDIEEHKHAKKFMRYIHDKLVLGNFVKKCPGRYTNKGYPSGAILKIFWNINIEYLWIEDAPVGWGDSGRYSEIWISNLYEFCRIKDAPVGRFQRYSEI